MLAHGCQTFDFRQPENEMRRCRHAEQRFNSVEAIGFQAAF